MLLDRDRKFICVHILKTRGSSVRKLFERHRPWYWLQPKKRLKTTHLLGVPGSARVGPVIGVRCRAGSERKPAAGISGNYFEFAFVRNPWDWLVSLYHFRLMVGHPQHKFFRSLGFDKCVEWWIENDLPLHRDFVCDSDGGLLLDYVGKL
jgi:hypothetical protein